jgi:hypothetical protein
MGRLARFACLVALLLAVGVPGKVLAQQTGGSLSGVVRDAQGAALPGATVTVTSPALIGGSRTAPTGPVGGYRFADLPPGLYDVTYERPGVATLKREGIRIQVAVDTTLDVELKVGARTETVTVSGESPVVDVTSSVTQTNIDKDLYETIPTGRNPWVMAGLVPGVITGRLDVGGTEGMQQYNLEVFGSADSQKSFSIDGLKTNWPGGNGGATMQYYGFEMYEEYNMQTASGTAESDVAGIYMNMVTKSGSNKLTSEHTVYFMNDGLQTDNIDDDLRGRLGLAAGAQTGAAGNPIKISYDWSSTVGGPIKRDKLWFFGALRWWRLDQFQIGARNPDGSQAIDDNRIRNFMGKLAWQGDPKTRASVMFNRNLKDRFHRRDAPFLFVEDKASLLQDQPAQNFVVQVNRTLGTAAILDVRFGRMWGTFPNRYQKEVGPNDIAIRDIVRNTRINAAEENFENPNYRWQLNASLSAFNDNFLGGSHAFKVGVQIGREEMKYSRRRNGDILLELNDGVPFRAQLANTPIQQVGRINTWGAFAQDQWRVKRLAVNAGVRVDGVLSYLPAQSSPAGTWVGERRFDKADAVLDFKANVAPRIGLSYDLLGNGRTALKAYYGRFYNQFGSELPDTVNQNAVVLQAVSWNDLNGNLRADAGELGTFTGFPRGLFPRVDPEASRPYSDEFNVGIEHTLLSDLAVSVSYHRRRHREGLGILDLARPPSAYRPATRTYTDPFSGPQTVTIYVLDPAFIQLRDRMITNVAELRSNYDGLQIDVVKRMSRRWQLLAGLSLQRHRGFDHSGTFTNVDFSNPNPRINRDDSSIFIDLPWALTLAGSYLLPLDVQLSAKYTARAGDPLNRTVTFSGLTATQVSETVRVVPRGTDRTETVDKFVDVRIGKRFGVKGAGRYEATVDVFNLLNANHVLLQTEAIGTAFARPSRILSPRIVRFGLSARF